MTRRLEPEERIQELSGASVPFEFDIHAMVFSEDAPAMEAALHKRFSKDRLNLVNLRKEFFRTTLDDIEAFAVNYGAKIEFTKLAEARQFRESEALRVKAQQTGQVPEAVGTAFPEDLFAGVEDDA
ncbi:MAG: GIY-YIG nuclease family protein [Holophagaceae bacterium]|nr:GIY-YIG nuclease family protein [Holophagaceae bacterium]